MHSCTGGIGPPACITLWVLACTHTLLACENRKVSHHWYMLCFLLSFSLQKTICFYFLKRSSPSPRKYRRASQEKKTVSEPKEKEDRYKLPLPLEPKDDVYLTWCYQKTVYDTEAALELLKKFQPLDFTSPTQELYARITLDMTSEKKVLACPSHSLFYSIKANLATENGAAIVGGIELIKPILNEEIEADFYIAVPEITTKINPLRNFLKQKYPSMKNGEKRMFLFFFVSLSQQLSSTSPSILPCR
uniref:39S ribosomal protein L1, mitochondrial n=1 Tax=Laticauda laticaudata TaxID=8630 RepID=A0A8C5SZH1_LATLA